MLRNFWYGIKNIIRWAPVIWDDVDWDWTSLATIMEYKLRRSAHLEETIGHHTTSLHDAHDMKICANILKRLLDDNYWENAIIRFGATPQAAKFSMEQQAYDQRYLGLIIGKHLTGWWD